MAKNTAVKRAGRDSDQFMIRLPHGMRTQISRAAGRNGRSMNSEIVAALTQYFDNETRSAAVTDTTKGLVELVGRLDRKLAEIEGQHRELAALIREKK